MECDAFLHIYMFYILDLVRLGSASLDSEIKKVDAEAEKVRYNGLAAVAIPLSALFTNCTCISNSLKGSRSTLEEVIIILTLDKPLLSEHQKHVLNPMILTVGSATQMPDNLMSFEELRKRFVYYLRLCTLKIRTSVCFI